MTKSSKTPATPTTSTRHRTLSTPGSVTYIAGYPQKLYIYQLPASKYWWVRYYTGKSTVRRSTKTSNKRDAIAFAKKFFDDITHMQLHGMPVNTPSSFSACAIDMLKAEEAKLARGELTKITYDNTNYRMNKMVLPYFRKHEVGSIDYFALEGYLDKLSKQTPVNRPGFRGGSLV